MDERVKNLVLTVVGAILILVTALSLPALVYLEVSKQGSVSTQLAGLLAIPLAAGAAMIRAAFVSGKLEEAIKQGKQEEGGK